MRDGHMNAPGTNGKRYNLTDGKSGLVKRVGFAGAAAHLEKLNRQAHKLQTRVVEQMKCLLGQE